MPDILEINAEISKIIMGAQVQMDVYHMLTADDIVACPRVIVRVERGEKKHQRYVHFHPDSWAHVTPELIGKWFENEFEDIL
jgi:hypothetical protein